MSSAAVLRALGVGAMATLAVVAVVGLARAAAFDAEATRLATLGALVGGNLLMLQWYRHAAGIQDERRGNQAFGWLLAAVAATCAAVLLAAPLLPQFGLPDDVALQVAGAVLGAIAVAAALRLRRRAAQESAPSPRELGA